MQSDDQKHNPPEDEDIDDDLDIDDDFDDLDWDDFDDDEEEEGTDENSAAPQPPKEPIEKPAPTNGGERTFLQKHFNLIAITVGAIFIGGWLLLVMGGDDSGSPQPSAEAPIIEDGNDQMLAELPQTPQDNSGFLSDQQKLQRFEEAAKRGDPPMPVPLAPTEEIDALTPLPEEENEVSDADTVASLDEPLFSDDAEIKTSAPAEPVEQIDTMNNVQPVQENAQSNAEIERLTKTNDTLNQELADIKGEMRKSEEEFMRALQEKNSNIGILSENVSKLESEVKSLKSQLKNLKETKTETQAKQPTKTPDPAPKSVQPKPKPVVKAPAPKTVAPQPHVPKNWVLRSAQPGKAIVSLENSSDTRTVQVGDKLDGIGQINAIGIKDGKWVISGSSGKITQ